MYVERAELELELLVARIDRLELDHRPDRPPFEVWDRARQQRFIDTILRDWCVPAVHVAGAQLGAPEVVLDGCQRLHAVARFFHDELTCSCATGPSDQEVARLDGLRFSDLPVDVQCRVRRFRLQVITFFDYEAAELVELLDRLHEPLRPAPRVPAPRSGCGPRSPSRDRGMHRAPVSPEPIFDQVSAWFADLSEFQDLSSVRRDDPPVWTSPADVGDAAAQHAVDVDARQVTEAGLPQREPLARLVPGTIAAPESSASSGVEASGSHPREVGGRLASYQQGVLEGRGDHRAPAPDDVTGPIPHPVFDADDPS